MFSAAVPASPIPALESDHPTGLWPPLPGATALGKSHTHPPPLLRGCFLLEWRGQHPPPRVRLGVRGTHARGEGLAQSTHTPATFVPLPPCHPLVLPRSPASLAPGSPSDHLLPGTYGRRQGSQIWVVQLSMGRPPPLRHAADGTLRLPQAPASGDGGCRMRVLLFPGSQRGVVT